VSKRRKIEPLHDAETGNNAIVGDVVLSLSLLYPSLRCSLSTFCLSVSFSSVPIFTMLSVYILPHRFSTFLRLPVSKRGLTGVLTCAHIRAQIRRCPFLWQLLLHVAFPCGSPYQLTPGVVTVSLLVVLVCPSCIVSEGRVRHHYAFLFRQMFSVIYRTCELHAIRICHGSVMCNCIRYWCKHLGSEKLTVWVQCDVLK
jgi:hypothetical protein